MSSWVVGGTSGIGKAIASRLVDNTDGMVYVTGKDVDVTSYESLYEYAMWIVSETGDDDPLQHIYFCAGDTSLEWLGMMGPIETANQIGLLEVNAGGFINLMDVLVHVWNNRLGDILGDGFSVCAISSDASERPMRTSIGYCASKAALNMAIKVAARELGPRGWKVFGIAPGMIESTEKWPSLITQYIDKRVPEIRNWPNKTAAEYEREQAVVRNPLRIHPFTIADVAIDVVTKGERHMNGSIITVNGGR